MKAGDGTTRQVLLKNPRNTIGRGSNNDVIIDASDVSREHALITVEPAFVTLKDLGSRNGTFVNGQRIDTQVLAHGDSVKLGEFEMRFVIANQEFRQADARWLEVPPGMPLMDLNRDRSADDTPTTGSGRL